MYRPGKYYRRGRGRARGGYYRGFAYERSHHYKCKKSNFQHESMKDDPFSLEHMVILDETGEDLPITSAASPASCDSSDSASATTSDHFPSSHLVILDETHDDNDHPASPASCDSSASESATLSSATTKTSAVTTKIKTEKLEAEQTAVSPLSVISSCHSSNPAPEAEAVPDKSKKYSSKKRYAESSKTRNKESIKIFHVEPINNNKDVFKFLKTFAVANESDVVFANKVKEMFSDALMKYKQIKLEEIYCTEAEHSPTEEPTGSTADTCDHVQSSVTEADSLMENEDCVTAEADCSDDEDV